MAKVLPKFSEPESEPRVVRAGDGGERPPEVVLDAKPRLRPLSPADERPTAPTAPPRETQAPPAEAKPAPEKPKGGGRIRVIVSIVALVAIVAAIGFGARWFLHGRFIISTDDAYAGADTAIVAPKIAGYVKLVPVDNNSHVAAGDPLLLLDDSDYRIAKQQADAQVAAQQAALARFDQQIVAGQAQVTQAKAQVSSAKAGAANAKVEYGRATALLQKTYGTQQAVDATQAALLQANAGVDAANAGVATAEANLGVLAAQKVEASKVLDQYKLAADKAQLDLDHTIIRAPFDGVVGNKAADTGEYVQPGTRLMAVVPLQQVYIDANFKETQLARLKPGQSATISVDAYPGRKIVGTVDSISPASGSMFSLLPPDNATGNFTKVVQRLPVRIRVPADLAAEGLIRPGMSIVVSVDTRTGADGSAAH